MSPARARVLTVIFWALAVPLWAADAAPWPKFTDITEAAGIQFKHSFGDFEMSNIAEATGPGCCIFDYDNDGYLDLFIANGDPHHLYVEEATLARNDGHGKFIDMTDVSGDFFSQKFVGRGAAFADFDNDGDLDVVIDTINDRPHILRNDGGNRLNRIKVVPVRADTGLVALNAVVTVKANGLTQVQPVLAVNGYLTSSDPRPHFGLGKADHVESVEIVWPGGQKQVLTNVKANQILKVKQEGK